MDTRRFLLYLYDLLFGANKHSSGCLLPHNERMPIFTTYRFTCHTSGHSFFCHWVGVMGGMFKEMALENPYPMYYNMCEILFIKVEKTK